MKKKKISSVFWKELLMSKDFISTIVNFFVLVAIILFTILSTHSFDYSALLDIGTFTAVVSAFILNFISSAIVNSYKKSKEDETKVTTDYNKLSNMYSLNGNLLEYTNTQSIPKNIVLGRKKTTCNMKSGTKNDSYIIPIANIISLRDKNITFNNDNAKKIYKHPPEIDSIAKELMKAHAYSKTYNQLMIRCDAIHQTEEKIEIFFSKTTYYESLLTNRAIDYVVNGTSVRDLFAYGPYLCPLEDSLLSNHMGYNGFIETQDEKIVFIFRNKYVSIAKNTMQSSIGASLKVKYACQEKGIVTKEAVVRAIKKEIEDELCLRNLSNYSERCDEILKDFNFDNILYFYRELTEGGKPQFMFYAKLSIHSEELRSAYTKGCKIAKKGNFYYSVDGFKMLFVEKSKLKDMYISPDGMTIDGKYYKSVPTSTGTLALLIQYLTEKGEI